MDVATVLPSPHGKKVIFIVVSRFPKVAYFVPLTSARLSSCTSTMFYPAHNTLTNSAIGFSPFLCTNLHASQPGSCLDLCRGSNVPAQHIVGHIQAFCQHLDQPSVSNISRGPCNILPAAGPSTVSKEKEASEGQDRPLRDRTCQWTCLLHSLRTGSSRVLF